MSRPRSAALEAALVDVRVNGLTPYKSAKIHATTQAAISRAMKYDRTRCRCCGQIVSEKKSKKAAPTVMGLCAAAAILRNAPYETNDFSWVTFLREYAGTHQVEGAWLNYRKSGTTVPSLETDSSTFEGCATTKFHAVNGAVEMTLIIWDGESIRGTRTLQRCEFKVILDVLPDRLRDALMERVMVDAREAILSGENKRIESLVAERTGDMIASLQAGGSRGNSNQPKSKR